MIEHTLQEDVLQILRLLSTNSGSQRDLAGRLKFSLGKTNYLLHSLIQKGFIEIRNFTEGDQKMKKVCYHLTRKGFRYKVQLAYYFLRIKEKEYFKLKRELASEKKGAHHA